MRVRSLQEESFNSCSFSREQLFVFNALCEQINTTPYYSTKENLNKSADYKKSDLIDAKKGSARESKRQKFTQSKKLSFSDYICVVTASSLNLISNNFRELKLFSLFGLGERVEYRKDIVYGDGNVKYQLLREIKNPVLARTKNKHRGVGNKFIKQAWFHELNFFINDHFYVAFSPYVNVIPMSDSLMRRVNIPKHYWGYSTTNEEKLSWHEVWGHMISRKEILFMSSQILKENKIEKSISAQEFWEQLNKIIAENEARRREILSASTEISTKDEDGAEISADEFLVRLIKILVEKENESANIEKGVTYYADEYINKWVKKLAKNDCGKEISAKTFLAKLTKDFTETESRAKEGNKKICYVEEYLELLNNTLTESNYLEGLSAWEFSMQLPELLDKTGRISFNGVKTRETTKANKIFVRKIFQPVRTAARFGSNEEVTESYGSLPIVGDNTYEGNFELFTHDEKRPDFAKNYRIWYSVMVNKVDKELKGPVKDFFKGKSLTLESILSSLIKKDMYRQHIYSDKTDKAYNGYCDICQNFWDYWQCNVIQKEGQLLPKDFELHFYIHSAIPIE